MSDICNALKMIIVLKNSGRMKIVDIAKKVGVDQRTVRRYRQHLNKAGFEIRSVTGPHGGYQLLNNPLLGRLSRTSSKK